MTGKILFWQWNSFMGRGIERAMKKLEIPFHTFFYQLKNWESDPVFQQRLRDELCSQAYRAVFSVNYTPLITQVCEELGMLYICWVYDSPIHIRAVEPLKKECNRLYFFDRGQAQEYRQRGIDARYMPLAADPLVFSESINNHNAVYQSQAAMVGQLYQTEYSHYMTPLDGWTRGYLEGILASQMKLYGAYLLPDMITEELLESMNASYARASGGRVRIEKRELEYMLACEVTGRERRAILGELAKYFEVKLYAPNQTEEISGVTQMGYVDYYTGMPKVFSNTKVNLNISLKTIRTGIPLRVLDVLACGGFLVTNYQSELAEYFQAGEELVIYQDVEEVPEIVRYFLEHEEERRRIAAAGRLRIERDFRFEDRINEMLYK